MARAMRIRKGDDVIVMSGKDRGKKGRVIRAEPRKRRVWVEGLNIIKKNQRPTAVKDTQKGSEVGGIIEKEGPINVSNVMLLDPQGNKHTRIGADRSSGKRERVAKRSGAKID